MKAQTYKKKKHLIHTWHNICIWIRYNCHVWLYNTLIFCCFTQFYITYFFYFSINISIAYQHNNDNNNFHFVVHIHRMRVLFKAGPWLRSRRCTIHTRTRRFACGRWHLNVTRLPTRSRQNQGDRSIARLQIFRRHRTEWHTHSGSAGQIHRWFGRSRRAAEFAQIQNRMLQSRWK